MLAHGGDVIDDELDAILALPAVEPEPSGQVKRGAAVVKKRRTQRRVGGAEGDRLQAATVLPRRVSPLPMSPW